MVEVLIAYNYIVVLISVLIAIFAANTTLEIVGRVNASKGKNQKLWLLAGSFTMGLGIWSMHFSGMLALEMGHHVVYDGLTTILSLVIAIIASFFAFYTITFKDHRHYNLILSALIIGSGISSMHYIGMHGMKVEGTIIEHDYWVVAFSILIAIVISYFAIYIFSKVKNQNFYIYQLPIAILIGLAISGMHYIGIHSMTIYSAPYNHDHLHPWEFVINSNALLISLVIAIFALVGIMHTISLNDRKNSEAKIKLMAYYDSLTNLPNRQLLNERLKKALTESEQKNQSFAVLFIDLDRFKFINDTMGHNVGDLLLKEVAKRLQLSIRDQDMVSRLGGDEFIILLNNVEKEEVNRIAHSIIAQFKSPLDLESVEELFISPSIGISIYPNDANNIDAMIKYADAAMYMAKAKGRNNFQYYTSDMNQILERKVSVEKNLRKAIQNQEMEIYYQPVINLESRDLIGAEALLRWTNPEMGVISPVEFIPIAEETGLIQEIGEWVLKEACTQNKQWLNQGYSNLQIMVNISIRQLQNRNFYYIVERILTEVGLDPKHLILEITETILHDPHDSIALLNQLREKGVKIALDDFGTGYSSLSYLKHLPIDRLKIDRSFIQDLATNSNAVSMVKSIIDIGRNLDLRIIAEGIETDEQFAVLKDLHCTVGQGYYFSKPLSSKTFERTILKGSL